MINKLLRRRIAFLFCVFLSFGARAMDEDLPQTNRDKIKNLPPLPPELIRILEEKQLSSHGGSNLSDLALCPKCHNSSVITNTSVFVNENIFGNRQRSNSGVSGLIERCVSHGFYKPSKCLSCGTKEFFTKDIPEFFTKEAEDISKWFLPQPALTQSELSRNRAKSRGFTRPWEDGEDVFIPELHKKF